MATVLLVEDNADIREMLGLALRLGGYSVAIAANGNEALTILRTRPLPCVILLDLMMPIMNGWQLAGELRQDPRLSRIPIVIVSATAESADTYPPAAGYLSKPVDIDRLIDLVGVYCEAGGPVRETTARRVAHPSE